MNYRLSSLLVLCLPLAASCLQKLDSGLASGGARAVETELPPCDAEHGFACHFEPNLVTPEGLEQIHAHITRIEASMQTEPNVLLRERWDGGTACRSRCPSTRRAAA